MRIAIVDDLAKERASLHLQLGQILNLRSVCAEILEYESGEAFLAAEKEQRFTAAFLDIYMDGMSGMDAARELRKMDTDCMLVFTTTSTDHALEGFQVRAMHYLVKPFSAEELERLTDEMLVRMPYPDKCMVLKVDGSDIRLGFHNIIYAEHFAHMINVHTTARKTISTRQTFKIFTEKLKEESRFFICGRGVIVNLEHASDFENEAFCMEDGSRIYVNKELLKSARQAFMEFLLQRGYQS